MIIVLREHAPRLRPAADNKVSAVAGRAVQRAVVAGLSAVLPAVAAKVAIHSACVVIAVLHACPVVCPRDCVHFALMDQERTDALGFSIAHAATISPGLSAF